MTTRPWGPLALPGPPALPPTGGRPQLTERGPVPCTPCRGRPRTPLRGQPLRTQHDKGSTAKWSTTCRYTASPRTGTSRAWRPSLVALPRGTPPRTRRWVPPRLRTTCLPLRRVGGCRARARVPRSVARVGCAVNGSGEGGAVAGSSERVVLRRRGPGRWRYGAPARASTDGVRVPRVSMASDVLLCRNGCSALTEQTVPVVFCGHRTNSCTSIPRHRVP